MEAVELYDDDIVAWAEQQAQGLRALAKQPGISNALDWENVAEEIESVGRSQIYGVQSKLIKAFAHLMKLVSDPLSTAARGWRAEIRAFQRATARQYTPSMAHRISLDDLWLDARRMASDDLADFGAVLAPSVPDTCPFAWRDLLDRDFDVDSALLRIADPNHSSQ